MKRKSFVICRAFTNGKLTVFECESEGPGEALTLFFDDLANKGELKPENAGQIAIVLASNAQEALGMTESVLCNQTIH